MITWLVPNETVLAIQVDDRNHMLMVSYSVLGKLCGLNNGWTLTDAFFENLLSDKPQLICVWKKDTVVKSSTLDMSSVLDNATPAECQVVLPVSVPVGVEYTLRQLLQDRDLSIPDAVHQLVLDLYWEDRTMGGLVCSPKAG